MISKVHSQPFVSVIIPAKNEGRYISDCLESIRQQDYPQDRYEIIVVDNGSTDDTYKIAAEVTNKTYRRTGVAVGAVRNYGVTQSSGDVLAFIDADCIASRNWLTKGIKLITESPQAVVGGGIRNPANATWVEKSWILEGEHPGTIPKELIGANFFIKKCDFEGLGGFNEKVTSGEDSDLSLRAKAFGLKLLISHENQVTHLGNAKDIFSFMRRQIWHSENYISNIRQSMFDPVFYITVAFLLGLILVFLGFMIRQELTWSGISLVLILPAILMLKRIVRSRVYAKSPIKLFLIYIMDFTYLVSRSIGLVRGIGSSKYFTNSNNMEK